jgi:hypothetical protein
MGHRNREGLKPARRQGCFEVVRSLKLAQRLLDRTGISILRLA